MNRLKLYGVLIAALLLMFALWLVLAGTNDLGAGPNITPTLIVTARRFLPVIYGIEPLYTPTPTLPPPTVTPWASWTPTMTPSPTATNTPGPSPTATNTATPKATSEFQLPKPTLYAINNADGDGNYTVAWTSVPGATRYFLKENFNNTSWETIYDGPALSVTRTNMPAGSYCYNVRAYGPAGRSAWAGEQCTVVDKQPAYSCEFQTLTNGPRSTRSDLEVLPDGRLFITGGITELGQTADNAYIFNPTTRQFKAVPLPQGGGQEAVVLADGRVMLTVYGDDAHTMIYDPVSEAVSPLDEFVGCLEVHRILGDGHLLTYCGSTDGSIRAPASGYAGVPFALAVNYLNYAPESFAVPLGPNSTLLTNGVLGDIVQFADPNVHISPAFDHRDALWAYPELSMATSAEMDTLYFTGGFTYDDWGNPVASRDAYAIDLGSYSYAPIANMLTARRQHEAVGLADGSLMVSGGYVSAKDQTCRSTVEIYDPARDKWFNAGSLNNGRCLHQAIQLPNGEIFVYAGQADPGPPDLLAPPEIGRCELVE